MAIVNHLNLADKTGAVYCCLRNRVVHLDKLQKGLFCGSCKMYRGDIGGMGVECSWDDMRQIEAGTVLVDDPFEEWRSNQQKSVETA